MPIPAAQSGDTPWTSVDGVTIQARLLGGAEAHVFLLKNGQDYRVPFGRLTPECVAKVRRLLDLPAGKPAQGPAAFRSQPPERPVTAPAATPKPQFGYIRLAAPSTAASGPEFGNIRLPAPAAGATVLTSAAGTRRDKHSMPVYGFSVRQRIVRTTAYACNESDHLIYGNRNAIGTPLQYTSQVHSAAADWSFYPLGTTFRIKGLPHLFVVDDYGSALTGTGTIDIYQPSMDAMRQWGRRNVELTIVQWGSLARSAEILRQRTGFNHCRQMLANIVRLRPNLGQWVAR